MEPWGETAGARLRQAGLAGRETREETTQARQVPPGREDSAKEQEAPPKSLEGRRRWLHGTEAALVLKRLLGPV